MKKLHYYLNQTTGILLPPMFSMTTKIASSVKLSSTGTIIATNIIYSLVNQIRSTLPNRLFIVEHFQMSHNSICSNTK